MKKQNNITTLNNIKNDVDTTTSSVVDQNSTQMVEDMMTRLNAEHRGLHTTPTNTTTTTTTTTPTQTIMDSNNNNNNESNDTQAEIPDTTAGINIQEINKQKYEYLQRKKELARNQSHNVYQSRRNNTQEITDAPNVTSNPTLPNSGETAGDRLRASSRMARHYSDGVTAVAEEQERVAIEMTQINENINTLVGASRRLGLQYINFMWTNPFVGVMTTGAILGITAMVFRSGTIGYVGRSLISYISPINRDNAIVTTVSGRVAQASDVENVVQRLMREGWNYVSTITHTGGGLYFIRILFRGVRRGR